MTLRERQYRSPLAPATLVLERLYREQSADFGAVCDMVSIPRDLRRGTLAALIDQGYLIAGREGQIQLTARGIQVASASRP